MSSCLAEQLHCQLAEEGLLDRAIVKVLDKVESAPANDLYGERLPSEQVWDYYLAWGTVKINPLGNPYLRYGQGIKRDLDLTIYRLPRLLSEGSDITDATEDDVTLPHVLKLPEEEDFLIHRGVEYEIVGIEPINASYVPGAGETQTGWRVYCKRFS